ncbi:dynamin family protein [Halobacillus rhizosphaerae]|uniref:dynamin family protein n=1 Tax=Halobacillus rhizosphaerae TaxID=3064889 RepID=UPI00398B3935
MTVTTAKTGTQLNHLYNHLLKIEKKEQASKVLDLISKIQSRQMMIGFAGHFSAGKSTMINRLVHTQILPSSPIPTSANIVKLLSGSPYTVTRFREGPPERYDGDIDFETVKEMCLNGEEITGVDISRPLDELPEHVALLDTPGVDSSNDADRLITESSLHLMDYMYYIMDYNHVQSEVNLRFLLDMQTRGTPFSIVVNQVDKHQDSELSFKEFKESIQASLQQWGITPEKIYYTSLKNETVGENQLDLLVSDFEELFNRDYSQIEEQASKDAQAIVNDTIREEEEIFQEKRQELLEEEETATHILAANDHIQDWEAYFLEQEQKSEELHRQFKERVLSFLPNAYLMPSTLRDKAKAYLEASQSGFKVGMLFTKKKTEEELQRRENDFYSGLIDVMEKNLKWPLRDRIMEIIDAFEIKDSSIIEEIQQFSLSYEKDRLRKLIEPGASVTGDYVLRYTEQVAKDIKQQYRTRLLEWQERMKEILQERNRDEKEQYKEIIQALENKKAIEKKLDQLDENFHQTSKLLKQQLSISEQSDQLDEHVKKALKEREVQVQLKSLEAVTDFSNQPLPSKQEWEASAEQDAGETSSSEAMKHAEEALTVLQETEGLKDLYEQLQTKQNRLANQSYTVALFGAFSAGKSSFANALLGDRVLPVSPNPTTATINKICPPTEQFPDRTIRVKVKTEQQLLEDFSQLIHQRSLQAKDTEELMVEINKWTDKDFKKLEQKQLSFIKAFQSGYDYMSPYFGTEMTITWEQFSSFVAEEQKSCFIEWMELYYDCEWTRAGITLVDTPGADSVNARHTDVSFEYIKNADAVLFVTYYNHPFSKADQAFLTQLGRVKDTFAMDKMFFIINASDLADSPEEVQQVESYLKDQLTRFNIRHPRLYSLSSLQALSEKMDNKSGQSGMNVFEDRFSRFLHEELADVLIQSIYHDIKAAKDSLHEFIRHAKLNQQERELQLKTYQENEDQAVSVIEKLNGTSEYEPIRHKVEKQIHYVHERMMLNFHDFFKQQFNPAVINGKNENVKEQVDSAGERLVREIDFEMKQELRAVSLRIERLLTELLQQKQAELEKELRKIHSSIEFSVEDLNHLSSPEFNLKFELDKQQYQDILRMFKNTKTFFEKNEKEEMKEALSARFNPHLKQVLGDGEDILTRHYESIWDEVFQQASEQWTREIRQFFNRLSYSLTNYTQVNVLEDQYARLETIHS